jgi:seryl-tRNA synthetase
MMTMSNQTARKARNELEQAHFDAIDAEVEWLARELGGRDVHFPVLIGRECLERAGYTDSFPHLLMSAGAMSGSTAWCLSPAVCYHVYEQLAGLTLSNPQTITARGTCFRAEAQTEPGVRQIEFEMREIVCVGPPDWVSAQLTIAVKRLTSLARRLGLDGVWEPAEDPFFLPAAAGKALVQRLLGVKEEYRSQDVALASVNRHGTFFSERFAIRGANGSPIHTGCLAVGLDRWCAQLSSAVHKGRTSYASEASPIA